MENSYGKSNLPSLMTIIGAQYKGVPLFIVTYIFQGNKFSLLSCSLVSFSSFSSLVRVFLIYGGSENLNEWVNPQLLCWVGAKPPSTTMGM